MLGTIILKELQNHFYSLRFLISLIIVVLIFGIGTPGVVKTIKTEQDQYAQFQQNKVEELKRIASDNLTQLATKETNQQFYPRSNRIISDCNEITLPNEITYSAYNVFGFDVSLGSINPLLKKSHALTWSFVVIMILSFLALLFAFDSISGEKESKTLALSLSNSISRGSLLFGKFLSIVGLLLLIEFLGVLVGLIIILISGGIQLDAYFISDCFGFLILSLLCISSFTAFGMLSSVLAKNSNVSLLISLSIWLLFVIIIPNSAVYLAMKVFPIDSAYQVQQRIDQDRDELNKAAPEGSWSSNSSDPFYPQHELRANLLMSFLQSDKKQRDAHYSEMMRQFEKTRNLTLLSPVALFDYSTEAFLGGGYYRFRKNWDDLHVYQEQFLAYFKEVDMADEGSPHWYNPYESYSTTSKSVDSEEVPTFTENTPAFGERLAFMLKYIIILIVYTGVIFSLCFIFFMRYDPR